jgi:hypothetical protein
MSDGLVVRQALAGGFANRMFEHMLAVSLVRRFPGARLTGDPLPDWGIRPPRIPLPSPRMRLEGHRPDLPRIAYLVRSGLVRGIETVALGLRMELLDPVEQVRALFPGPPAPEPAPGPDDLVISIRGAEILGGIHKDYRPLPIAFYERLVAETGRRPVFLGQLGADGYSAALRDRFPCALFLESRGAMADFAALRAARHLVVSVSTFSWLAAWLSHAEAIHLPIAGMFHPGQRREIDMLPVTDPRYRFHLFPPGPWKGGEAEMAEVIGGAEAGREMAPLEAFRLAHGAVVLEGE